MHNTVLQWPFCCSSLQSHVTWNASSIPYMYMPPNHTYTCAESTLYPTPGLVEGLNVTSCSTNGSHTRLQLEWSPPTDIPVQLQCYDVCTGSGPGVFLVPDQEMSGLNDGSRQCLKINYNVC